MQYITMDSEGLVISDRIVAVGRAESAAMKRLLGAVPLSQVVSLTGGRRRQSVLVLDSGHLVISALTVEEIAATLEAGDGRTGDYDE